MDLKKNKIGILGGSFDPAHKGHIAISKEAKKKSKLKSIIWAITKKNPFKKKSNLSVSARIKYCKKIIGKNNFIKVKFYEDIIRSNKTIDLINFLCRNKKNEIYFLMGADNLINFHKWTKWKKLVKLVKLVVFFRKGYDKKGKDSIVVKHLDKKNIIYINNKSIDISSSEIKKNYLKKNK